MVWMLLPLYFMMDMVLINQIVCILLILMVVIFVLSIMRSLNGWNTAQALIKHFALLVVCLDNEAFISNGFQNWKSALEKFHAHQCSVAHKSVVLAWETGKQTQPNPERNVMSLINQQQKKGVDKNRVYLISIVKTLVILGRQGISLRGHRENEESNRGNFLELLMFQAKNNPSINQHFANKEKGVTYTSPGIQNKLLNIIGENIRDSTINQIKEARMFALILDESLDISRHEQAAVVLRYVNPHLL